MVGLMAVITVAVIGVVCVWIDRSADENDLAKR